MRRLHFLTLAFSLALLAACGDGSTTTDAGPADAAPADARPDALASDGSVPDTGTADAGDDAAVADAGDDAAVADAGGDAAVADAGDDATVADAGDDAAVADAGGDAAVADAGGDAAVADAGGDAAVADAGGDAGTGPDGAACSLVGDYSLTFMGVTAYFRFAADLMWGGAADVAGLDAPVAFGPYTFDGTTLTLHDTDTSSSCATTDVGTYTVAFEPGCAGFTLTRVSDPCTSRSTVLGGLLLTRLP